MKRVIIIFFSLALMLAASVGKIAVSKGDVFVVRGAQELSAKSGFELQQGDIVRTSEGGLVQIVFSDDTIVSIGKASEFQVDEFMYEEGAGEDRQRASFKALKGAFKTITGQIGKIAPKKFNIQSRTATIGIRGTHLLGKISVEADKIACTHGAIGVTSLAGGDEIVVPAGQITTVAMGEMPTPPRKYTAAEIQELNEASGAGDKEADEPAAAAKGEGEKEDKAAEDEPAAAEEEIAADDDTVVIAESESVVQTAETVSGISEAIESVSEEQSAAVDENIVQTVEKNTGVDLGEAEPEPVSSGMNDDGYYSLGVIKSTGPIDLYGKNLTSSIDSPECDEEWCRNGADTHSTGYDAGDEKVLRNGDYLALNEEAGLGKSESTNVAPELSFQSFTAQTETSDDAHGYIGQEAYYDTITGVVMMGAPSGSYEGVNVQYVINSETPTDSEYTYSWDEWWTYDNLGEFFVMASSTNSVSTASYTHNSGSYFGKKSSYDDMPADSYLIYKLMMDSGYGYDPAEDHVYSYLNQDFSGSDKYKSRVVGNTHNGNILFVVPGSGYGDGWGFVLSKTAIGASGEVTASGFDFWVSPRNEEGVYTLDTRTHVANGELYGSELQGVGMQLVSGDSQALDTANFADSASGPSAFEATLAAGYRTDSADMIDLPDAPQTGSVTLEGFTATRAMVGGTWEYSPSVMTLDIDRDTGDVAGDVVFGALETDGTISSAAMTMTIEGTGGVSSAYISDNYFASAVTTADASGRGFTTMTPVNSTGGYLATMPLFPVEDVTWGFWTAEYLADDTTDFLLHHQSSWVAGEKTAESTVSALLLGNAVYSYEGKVLGRVLTTSEYTDTSIYDTIDTANSRVRIALDFGSSAPVSGDIAFGTIRYPNMLWYADIDSSGSAVGTNGYINATLGEKTGSAVEIAGGNLHANLYGESAASLGGKFDMAGTIDGYSTLLAAGVIKASTDIDLLDYAVFDKALRGVDFYSWLSNPTVSDTYSSSSGESDAGHVNNSNFVIGLSGDTLEYQSFGTSEYLYSWNGSAFVEGSEGVVEPEAGTLSLGSGTVAANTMMSEPTGLYSSLNIETSVDADGVNRYVVYDNTKEFFTIVEERTGDSVEDSYYGILMAGTESDYAELASEADYLTYRLVGAVDLTIDPTIIETGAYTGYVTGAAEAEPMTLTINTNNDNFISISKPHENGSGQYDLAVMFGQVGEDTYTGSAYVSGTDFLLATDGDIDVSHTGGELFGSENQGLGISSMGYVRDTHLFASFAKTDETGLVNIPSSAATGTTIYTGRVAAIQDVFTAQFGTIENMSIDKDTGLISGGTINVGDISAGEVLNPVAAISMNSGGYAGFSSYVSDDYMAVLLDGAGYDGDGDAVLESYFSYSPGTDGGVMLTSDEQAGSDYASWGYWAASFGDPSSAETGFKISPVSTWIAGELTSNPSVIEGLQAGYTGKVLGFVADVNENFEMIDTANSLVNINIDFGAANPVTGSMSFSSASTAWSMDIGSGTISSSTACFNAQLTNASGGTVIVTEGEMYGNFYGPNADTLGASFGAGGLDTISGNIVAATGAIKASKNP